MSTVYVLGAGATRAMAPKVPLNDDLLPGILQRNERDICQFLYDFYRFSSEEGLPPIEDVLSQIDFAINENRPISSRYTVEKMRDLRKDLILNICDVVRGGKDVDFTQAVKTMQPFIQNIPDSDCIVSLNYDLVTDTAIRSAHNWQYVDYGYPIRKAITHDNSVAQINEHAPLKLYKLHGSLNWLFCPLCRAVDSVDGHVSGEHYISDSNMRDVTHCPVCGVAYEQVIVTPSFLKSYDNLYIAYMWHQAELMLSQADEIVFIGYSMPDADMVLRCMFRRAYFTHMDIQGKKSKVRVIDYAPNYDPAKPPEVFSRYKRLFGEIEYDPRGFTALIDDMIAKAASPS